MDAVFDALVNRAAPADVTGRLGRAAEGSGRQERSQSTGGLRRKTMTFGFCCVSLCPEELGEMVLPCVFDAPPPPIVVSASCLDRPAGVLCTRVARTGVSCHLMRALRIRRHASRSYRVMLHVPTNERAGLCCVLPSAGLKNAQVVFEGVNPYT